MVSCCFPLTVPCAAHLLPTGCAPEVACQRVAHKVSQLQQLLQLPDRVTVALLRLHTVGGQRQACHQALVVVGCKGAATQGAIAQAVIERPQPGACMNEATRAQRDAAINMWVCASCAEANDARNSRQRQCAASCSQTGRLESLRI